MRSAKVTDGVFIRAIITINLCSECNYRSCIPKLLTSIVNVQLMGCRPAFSGTSGIRFFCNFAKS